jgi:hypothetical protein
MRYILTFNCISTKAEHEEIYWDKSTPMIPSVGDKVYAGMFEQVGIKQVIDVVYGYSQDQISISIIVKSVDL